jgi:hypothetical protein
MKRFCVTNSMQSIYVYASPLAERTIHTENPGAQGCLYPLKKVTVCPREYLRTIESKPTYLVNV